MAAADETRRMLARHAWRLAPDWQPGCFVGTVARVIEARSRDVPGGAPDDQPAHYVGAAWPPAEAAPHRWPDAVVIASPNAEHALLELLLQLPADAKLHLVQPESVDLALAVEIVREADRNLQSWQHEALGAFLDDWRAAEREAIRQRFTDRDDGFERFVERLTGQAPPGGDAGPAGGDTPAPKGDA